MSSLDDLVDQLLQDHATKKAAAVAKSPAGMAAANVAAGAEVESSFEQLIKSVKGDSTVAADPAMAPGSASPDVLADLNRARQQAQQLAAERDELRLQVESLKKQAAAAPVPAAPLLAEEGALSSVPLTQGTPAGASAFPWRRHITVVDDSVRKKDLPVAEPLIKILIDVAEAIGAEPATRVRLTSQLATIRIGRGEFAEAEEILTKALNSMQATDNAGAAARASCLDALAQCFQERKDYDQAEKLRREAVVLAEEALGGEHPDVGYFRERLDTLRQERQLNMIGTDEASKTLLDKLTEEYNANVAAGLPPVPEDAKPADSYSGFMLDKFLGMAKTALQQKNLREAENALRSAMEKADNVPNADPRKCESIRLMAHVMELLGKENSAKELYEKALTIAFRYIGWGDIQVAQTLHALAKLHHQLNDLGLTKNYYNQAIAVYTNLLGRDNETTAGIQQEYAEFLERVKSERQWKGWAV